MVATRLTPFRALAGEEDGRDYIKVASRKSRSPDSNSSELPSDFSCLCWKSHIDCVSVGVDRMQRNFEPMRKQVEEWQRSELTDVAAFSCRPAMGSRT